MFVQLLDIVVVHDHQSNCWTTHLYLDSYRQGVELFIQFSEDNQLFQREAAEPVKRRRTGERCEKRIKSMTNTMWEHTFITGCQSSTCCFPHFISVLGCEIYRQLLENINNHRESSWAIKSCFVNRWHATVLLNLSVYETEILMEAARRAHVVQFRFALLKHVGRMQWKIGTLYSKMHCTKTGEHMYCR